MSYIAHNLGEYFFFHFFTRIRLNWVLQPSEFRYTFHCSARHAGKPANWIARVRRWRVVEDGKKYVKMAFVSKLFFGKWNEWTVSFSVKDSENATSCHSFMVQLEYDTVTKATPEKMIQFAMSAYFSNGLVQPPSMSVYVILVVLQLLFGTHVFIIWKVDFKAMQMMTEMRKVRTFRHFEDRINGEFPVDVLRERHAWKFRFPISCVPFLGLQIWLFERKRNIRRFISGLLGLMRCSLMLSYILGFSFSPFFLKKCSLNWVKW